MTLNLKGEIESEHFSPPSRESSSSHTSSSSLCKDRIKPSKGGLLVVRRMLGQVPKELESFQREYVFHKRCLINDKLIKDYLLRKNIYNSKDI